MPKAAKTARKATKSKRKAGPGCPQYRCTITCLGEYFNTLQNSLKSEATFWFRGHPDLTFSLTPSALRYHTPNERKKALDLLGDFKRFGEIKLPNPPSPDHDVIKWVQLAQHYGLPTRLLDWTKNAAIALYFACQPSKKRDGEDTDGAVIILNPIDLNRAADPRKPRVFNLEDDKDAISAYLKLDGKEKGSGPTTIAIDPTWNSERIMLQQGVFTLHGSKYFTLTDEQAPGLTYLRIKTEHKSQLLKELERTGINEMAIFPEPEHMCQYLKWREELILKG